MTARKFVPAIPASQSRTDAGPYGNPFPRTEDAASLATMAPLFAALDLDLRTRIADLDRMLTRRRERMDEERDAAAIDAAEDARMAPATEQQAQDDADELAGARDAASWFPTPRAGCV
jgi:hypothetical protein